MRKSVQLFVIHFLFFGIAFSADLPSKRISQVNGGDFVGWKNNEIVVKFDLNLLEEIDIPRAQNEGRTGVSRIDSFAVERGISKLKQRYPNAPLEDIYGEVMNLRGWFKARFKDSVNAELVARDFKKIAGVVDAQPIGIHELSVVHPNDPRYTGGDMWYMDQLNDSDVDAPEAWDFTRGTSDIIVAPMDSGVRYYHKDLGGANASSSNPENARGNMWINETELNGTNGVDDDGNGYIDDWVGWDFVTGNPQSFDVGDDYDVEDNDPRDHNGHGTHTAGTVGAISNNGYGVPSMAGGNGESGGVGNGVKVMGLRIGWNDIFDLGFVGMDYAANALIYAADNGAHIASCSWGSSNSGGLEDALNYFLYGTTTPTGSDPQLRLVFKAAGNADDEGSDFMLDRSDVIGVAATDSNDVKADFSTYGTFVDISAPGTQIWSTYHNNSDPGPDYVAALDGTSMATPLVASIAAMVWAHNQALTADEVESILLSTADDIEGISGNSAYIGKLGSGRVNAYAAIQQADAALPVSLSSFAVRMHLGNVKLSWSTASEVNNSGFAIKRSTSENGEYELLADFTQDNKLRGQGNSSSGKSYSYTDFSVQEGQDYWYLLEDIDFNGRRTQHGPLHIFVSGSADLTKTDGLIPREYALGENYPNPFNPTTRFALDIPALKDGNTQITVHVYDLLGKRVRTLYDGTIAPGNYTFEWDGRNESGRVLPSGMYIYRVSTEQFSQARKMVLMK